MCGENARRRTLRSARWISMVVFAAIFVDMDRSLAFSPVADGHSGGAERRRTNSRIGFTSEESSRGTTDLNVAMSPPMNLQLSSSIPKNDNQQAPTMWTRSANELISLPSSSRAVSLGKRNRNSKMIRPKSLNSSARVQTVPERPDLLTREEEQNLTLHVRRLRQGARIRNELVTQTERQPAETEWAEACGLSVMELRRIMNDGQEARSVLVSANAGLVTSIAKRHYHAVKQSTEFGGGLGTILTMQDMIQEGNLGLMQAAERFEPERGLRFSTYATYWVRQRIFRSISDSSRTIRLPAHVYSTLKKINTARKLMREEIGRVPSTPELAHFLEMSEEKLRKYTSNARNVISLEMPVSTFGSFKQDRRTLGDNIVSDAPTPEEDAQNQYLKRDIRTVINELADRERDVVILRFGLDNGKPMTIDATANKLGISRDRVRMVEARALNKLRNPQRNYRLKNYVGGRVEEEHHHQQQYNEPKTVVESRPSPEKLWFF